MYKVLKFWLYDDIYLDMILFNYLGDVAWHLMSNLVPNAWQLTSKSVLRIVGMVKILATWGIFIGMLRVQLHEGKQIHIVAADLKACCDWDILLMIITCSLNYSSRNINGWGKYISQMQSWENIQLDLVLKTYIVNDCTKLIHIFLQWTSFSPFRDFCEVIVCSKIIKLSFFVQIF